MTRNFAPVHLTLTPDFMDTAQGDPLIDEA